MAYLKNDDKAAIEWLAKLIDNTITGDPNSRVMINSYQSIKAWHDCLANPIPDDQVVLKSEFEAELKRRIDAAKTAKPVKRVAKKTRTKKKPDVDPYTCKDHPTYQARAIPRRDCAVCWALYKQFHPQDYALKRRVFERKLKKNAQ